MMTSQVRILPSILRRTLGTTNNFLQPFRASTKSHHHRSPNKTTIRGLHTVRVLGTPKSHLDVNGVRYRLPVASSSSSSSAPLASNRYAVFLIDGGSEEYLQAARQAGCMPFIDGLLKSRSMFDTMPSSVASSTPSLSSASAGFHALVTGQVPSLTNPNNVAIVCGANAAVTGICGNYFLDETVDPPVERLMNSESFLRAPTVMAKIQEETGMKVTILTAKDKLLKLLSKGLSSSSAQTVALSIEKLLTNEVGLTSTRLAELTKGFYEYFEADPQLMEQLSEEQRECIRTRSIPTIYNPHISLYLLELGLALTKLDLANSDPSAHPRQPHFYYLSTTDYVQHKYLPTDAEALRFYRYIDRVLSQFHELGLNIGITADHGMNSKVNYDGQPKVIYIEEELKKGGFTGRVILPITDPYVKHHSSLGGYATVYLDDKSPESQLRAMIHLRQVYGIYTVLNREEACKAFDLPSDRIGDIVIFGDVSTVLGKSQSYHDLGEVHNLRSHGGIDESTVPIIFNRRLTTEYERRLTTGKGRNYQILEFMFNGMKQPQQ